MCIDENPSLGLDVAVANQIQVKNVMSVVHRPEIELEEIVLVEDKTEHEDSDMNFVCETCGRIFKDHRDITHHIQINHKTEINFKCSKCEELFPLETDLNEHIIGSHTEKVCGVCQFKCKTDDDLTKHKVIHEEPQTLQYNCNLCPFIVSSENDLEAHKKSKHEELSFKCEKCDYETTSELIFETHIRGHIGDIRSEDVAENLVAENATLKRKYQGILDSYDRLTVMYNAVKEDSKKKEDEYKKELNETQETLRITLSECEKLKETNDIQSNLWKIWLEEHGENRTTEKPSYSKVTSSKPSEEDEDILVEENIEGEDPLTVLLRNGRRGFSRVSPAAPPLPNSSYNKSKTTNKAGKNVSFKTSSYNEESANKRPSVSQGHNTKKYCHYWNNGGMCSYKNCRFLHEKSPVCKFDGRCTRNKCMFSHVTQNKSFLSERRASRTSWSSQQSPPVWAQAPRPTPQYWGPPAPAPWAQWGNTWPIPGVQQGVGNIRNC